jgi:hypothetical protein
MAPVLRQKEAEQQQQQQQQQLQTQRVAGEANETPVGTPIVVQPAASQVCVGVRGGEGGCIA